MQFRQGDILLIKVSSIPKSAKKMPAKHGRIILAEGESTGHSHSLDASRASLYIEKNDQVFLLAEDDCTLVHQEHAPIDVAAASYKVVRQREYQPEGIRNVMD